LKLVILDANVIIELFRLNLFSAVVGRYSIVVPTTIKQECVFFVDQSGARVDINWETFISSSKVEEVSADALDFSNLGNIFIEDVFRGIDAGELEALAIINKSQDKAFLYCSGDLPSLKALGALGRGSQAISLEKLLQNIGITKTLKRHFTEKIKNQEVGKAYAERDLFLKK
jgi:hypothetical protein